MTARILIGTALVALVLAAPAGAATRKQELTRKETFSAADAQKGQIHVKAAMSLPMEDMIRKANIQHPELMLQYGLGLYLGRDSALQSLSQGERDKLKAAYRALLDQYLTAADKFGDVTFDEDSMLDNGDFWVYLAEHIGRPKDRQPLNQTLGGSDQMTGATNMFIMDAPEDETNEYNLKTEPIIRRQVANAAITCTTTARSFARMKKAQTVDISETNLTPDKFAEMRVTAARLYRTSYALGERACASRENFDVVAAFAGEHLGPLGAKKDDPNAKPADLTTDAPKVEE